MTKFANPYERIQLYNSWLANNEELCLTNEFNRGVSMSFLSQISEIPITIIRKDICMILKWQSKLIFGDKIMEYATSLNTSHFIDIPEEAMESNSILNTYCEDIAIGKYTEKIENYILSGNMDEIPLCINSESEGKRIKLWVSPEEYEALKEYKVLHKTSASYEETFKIKDSYRYNHNYVNLTEHLFLIDEAIKNDNCIEITYRKPQKRRKSYTIKPIKIIYDTSENLYFLLATAGNDIRTYRLEYVLHICQSNLEIDSTIVEDKIKKIQPLVWGNSFTAKSIGPVKVKFYNEGKVWEKVKKEFANRDPSLLYEKDGFLYFESPEVYGGDGGANFLRWIRGFGSSAIIIAPKELRNRMIESYQKRLETPKPPYL